MNKELIDRPLYLDKLWKLKDNEHLKVLTGVRGSGKSSILKLFQQQLIESGIDERQILELNLELFKYHNWNTETLYNFVKEKSALLEKNERLYLFLDEVQNLSGWEYPVNSLRLELNIDIYITGSNAYLMSSNLTTLLSGRTSSLHVFPLSFKEYLSFHGFHVKNTDSKLLLNNWSIEEPNADIETLFNQYLKYGGFPALPTLQFDEFLILNELEELYNQVILKDVIYARLNSRERSITSPGKISNILSFMSSNVGSLTSISKISNTLNTVERSHKQNNYRTIQNYIDAFSRAYVLYPVECYDTKGKLLLQNIRKYYSVDTGLRNFLVGFPEGDRGHLLENTVFLELKRRDFIINVGRISQMEIDFLARKGDQLWYIQVTEDIGEFNIFKREVSPLKKAKGYGKKLIITGKPTDRKSFEDIKIISIFDFLLDSDSLS